MHILSIFLMIIWIYFVYFILDKKIAEYITKKFKPNKTYDDKNPYDVRIGPFGSYSPAIVIVLALIFVPAVFISKYGGTFNHDYLIGFTIVTFIAIIIGSLERIYYK